MFVTDLTKDIDATKLDNYTYDLWQFSGIEPNLYVILKANDNLDKHFSKILYKYPEFEKYIYSNSRKLICKVLLDDTNIIDNDGVFIFVDYQKLDNKEYEYKPFSETTKDMLGKFIRVITADNTGNVYTIEGIGENGIYIHYPHNDRIYFSLKEAFEKFAYWKNNEYIPFGEKK